MGDFCVRRESWRYSENQTDFCVNQGLQDGMPWIDVHYIVVILLVVRSYYQLLGMSFFLPSHSYIPAVYDNHISLKRVMKVIVNSGLFGFNNLVAEWKWLFSQMSVKAVGNKSWHNSDSVSYKRKLNSSSGVHTVSLQLRCGLPKKRTMYVKILQICVDVNKQDDVSQILWKIFRCVPLNPSVLVTNKWVLGNVGCVEIQGDSLGLILAVCFNTTWNYGSSLFCKGEVPKQIAATLRRRTSWNLTSACLPVVTDILVCVPDQFDIFSGTTTRSNFTEVVVPTFLIVLAYNTTSN